MDTRSNNGTRIDSLAHHETANHAKAFAILVTSLSALGVVINGTAMVILQCNKRCRGANLFHSLLKVLAVSDMFVVLGCGTLYGLPKVWGSFYRVAYPVLVPWVMPLTHVAVMVSVYCTVLLSFERYIRICYLCQLKDCTLITAKKFRYYLLVLAVFPALFYLPKFFEIRYVAVEKTFYGLANCSGLTSLQHLNLTSASGDPSVMVDRRDPEVPFADTEEDLLDQLVEMINKMVMENREAGPAADLGDQEGGGVQKFSLPQDNVVYEYVDDMSFLSDPNSPVWALQCWRNLLMEKNRTATATATATTTTTTPVPVGTAAQDWGASGEAFQNISHTLTFYELHPTALRKNATYYKVYSVFLNTLFSAIIPVASLYFFNVSTIVCLRKQFHNQLYLSALGRKSSGRPVAAAADDDDRGAAGQVAGHGAAAWLAAAATSCCRRPTPSPRSEPATLAATASALAADEDDLVGDPADVPPSRALCMACCEDRTPRRSSGPEVFPLVQRPPPQGEADYGKILDARRREPDGRGFECTVSCVSYPSLGAASDLLQRPASKASDRVFEADDAAAANRSPDEIVVLRDNASEAECPDLGNDSGRSSLQQNFREDQSKNEGERRLTRISISIVWLFLFCHMWKLIPTMYEAVACFESDVALVTSWPRWVVVVHDVSHALITANSAVNFLVYVFS